jgi:hypothetical protein
MESPMVAIESGRAGGGATATAGASPPAPAAAQVEAEAEVAVARVARTRATPAASMRHGLGISDLPGRAERDAGQRMTDFSVDA